MEFEYLAAHLRENRWGPFRIERRLHADDRVEVFLVVRTDAEWSNVVKVFRPNCEPPKAQYDLETLLRNRLGRDRAQTIHDVGRLRDGRLFFIAEYLSGPSFRAFFESQPYQLPLGTLLRIGNILADIVTRISALGFVHRGLSPDTVWLHRYIDDRYGVMIKRFSSVSTARPLADSSRLAPPPIVITKYSAPELQAGPVNDRADVFSVGSILHELLGAWVPAGGQQANQQVSVQLLRLLQRMVAVEPRMRPAPIDVAHWFALLLERLEGSCVSDPFTLRLGPRRSTL